MFLMYSVPMRIGQHRGRASMKRMWFASTSDCDVLRSNSSRQVESPYALNIPKPGVGGCAGYRNSFQVDEAHSEYITARQRANGAKESK